MVSSMISQHTLKNRVSCNGVGLHSGVNISMTLCPADPGTGIVFQRTDIKRDEGWVPALWDRVCDTSLCTAVSNVYGSRVGTVEHLMAAFLGCDIDNAVVELDGPEVPIMDGSSRPFVSLIEYAGLMDQGVPRQIIRVLKNILVEEKGRIASLGPGHGFSINLEIDFENPHVAKQAYLFDAGSVEFKNELSGARTFGFETDIEEMRNRGLALGGSLKNAIVVGENGVLNEGGLRYENEFARHKALDAMGDLYLSGASILGVYKGYCAGHALNNKLLSALFSDRRAWEMIEIDSEGEIVSIDDWDSTDVERIAAIA